MPSVEVRVDRGGSDGVPHVFLVLHGDDGSMEGSGYGPEPTTMWGGAGPSRVQDDTNHEFDRSWTYQVTQQQFDDVRAYIDSTRISPGFYEWWQRNCVDFVADALRYAGIDDLPSGPLTHPVELWWIHSPI